MPTGTRLLQPSGNYNNYYVNCGYYEISGYMRAQSMTTCVRVLYDAQQQVLQEVM